MDLIISLFISFIICIHKELIQNLLRLVLRLDAWPGAGSGSRACCLASECSAPRATNQSSCRWGRVSGTDPHQRVLTRRASEVIRSLLETFISGFSEPTLLHCLPRQRLRRLRKPLRGFACACGSLALDEDVAEAVLLEVREAQRRPR